MKKLLLLFATMLLSLPVWASTKIGNLYYDLDNSSMTAKVTYYSYSSSSNQQYVSGDLIIPETVTYNSKTYSVTSIGGSAFSGCTGLTSVEIPNSVTSIGDKAFAGCELKDIKLVSETPPSYYSVFADYALSSTLYIPQNTTFAYLMSRWREFINIQSNGEMIERYAQNDGVYNYLFLENEGKAYLTSCINNSISTASIPDRVVGNYGGEEKFYFVSAIGIGAFMYNSNLSQIKLPANLEIIGSMAFYDCYRLKGELDIPDSVTYIGDGAFFGCSGLTGELDIPEAVTYIGDDAFWGCSGLTGELDIPDSVTYMGAGAFRDCEGLTSVTIPYSVTSIGDYAFFRCFRLTSMTIPNSVTSIGNNAFYGCSDLRSVEIPNSVTSIGNAAFNDCSRLRSLTFEDGVEDLTFDDNSPDVSTLYLGRNLVGKYSFPKIESLTVGGFVTTIPNDTYYGHATLRSVTINPGGEVVIENDAFFWCTNLTELVLPEDISEIGDRAFFEVGLQNITVPGGVIGDNAFANCNLDNIILGANVRSIGENAFDGNNAIKNVYATPTTPPAAQNNTFSYYGAQLWVPEEAIDTYYNNTRCWYRFSGKPLVCPENITLSGPASFNGKPGETLQLTATISPANVTLDRVLWRSTNPAVATVDNNGLVTFHNFASTDETMALAEEESTGFCQIIASTLYEESPVAVVNIEVSVDGSNSIEYINSDDKGTSPEGSFRQNDIYTLQGVCLKHNASQDDINALAPGIYIICGKKVIIR